MLSSTPSAPHAYACCASTAETLNRLLAIPVCWRVQVLPLSSECSDPHLACNPAALAVGRELNRVQVAVLEEDVAVALVEDLLVPALAMVIRDHQQTLRANDVDAAVGANRNAVKRLPRMRAADCAAAYRGAGHKGAGYHSHPRHDAR